MNVSVFEISKTLTFSLEHSIRLLLNFAPEWRKKSFKESKKDHSRHVTKKKVGLVRNQEKKLKKTIYKTTKKKSLHFFKKEHTCMSIEISKKSILAFKWQFSISLVKFLVFVFDYKISIFQIPYFCLNSQ